jgi:DNA-binding protein YbaB
VSTNPFDGLDPDAVLRRLQAQAEDLESKASRLRAELATTTASASSPDGAVTVTLSSAGALEDIVFSTAVAEHEPSALGPLVMATVRDARQAVDEKLATAFGGLS